MKKQLGKILLGIVCVGSSNIVLANVADKAFERNQELMYNQNRVIFGKIITKANSKSTQIQRVVVLQKFEEGVNKLRLHIYKSGSWSGMGVLSHREANGKVSFWIRAPSSPSPREVASEHLYEEMLGTSGWKSDVVRTPIESHKRTVLQKGGPMIVNGKTEAGDFIKWKSVPVKELPYSHKVVWGNKANGLIIREHFFKGDILVRTNVLEKETNCQGKPAVWGTVSKNVLSGKSSEVKTSKVVYVKSLPNRFFLSSSMTKSPLRDAKKAIKETGAVSCKRPSKK
jgi:hypothetical protein